METKVGYQRYGKGCVRVVKVNKTDVKHDVREITATVQLEGNFDESYYSGNNSPIIATDSIKNTVYILSKDHTLDPIEDFAFVLCRHFLKTYSHVSGVIVKILETPWERLIVNGKPHAHAFHNTEPYVRFCDVYANRKGELKVASGVDKLRIMKTTQSGFTDFIRDKYTTLPETKDRIMKSSITAKWEYSSDALALAKQNIETGSTKKQIDFNSIFKMVLDVMIEEFAGDPVKGTYSPSVQQTLFFMGTKILERQPQIESVQLSVPNRHNILFDLSRFGLKNDNEVFFPSDEPYGLIEATVVRGKPQKQEGNGPRIANNSRL
jgi:urate oxidase